MTDQADQNPRVMQRLAGFMYVFGIAAFINGNTILGSLSIQGSFASEARAIASAQEAVRAALILMLATSWSNVILIGALYALLRPYGQSMALLATLWRMTEVGLGSMSCIFRFVHVEVYTMPTGLPCCVQQQLLSLSIDYATKIALDASNLFFAAGSCAFFALFYKSSLIPKSLAALGMLGSIIVGAIGVTELLRGQLATSSDFLWLPIIAAELATGVWLLFGSAARRPDRREGTPDF